MRRGVWHFMIVVLVLAGSATCANAQMVQIAPPISSDELSEYASMLDLSDAQFRAIDPLYQQYLSSYEAFLTGQVQPFEAAQAKAIDENPETFWTDESNVRMLHDRIVAFRRGAARIDDDFIETMQPVLTDEQSAGLEAVRMLRARQRVFLQGGTPIRFSYAGDFHERIELRRILGGLDLTGLEHDALEPLLRAHEQHVTGALLAFDKRRHHDQYIGNVIEKRDWQEMQQERLALVSAIRVSHRAAMERMLPLLSEENAAAFRDAVCSRLYPGVTPDPDGVDRHFDLFRAQSLTPEIREAIETLEAGYLQQHAALSMRVYDLIDAASMQVDFWVPTGGRQGAAVSRDILKALDARAQLNARTLEQLMAIVGEDRLVALADEVEKREPFPRAQDWITAPWPEFQIAVGGVSQAFWSQQFTGPAFYTDMTFRRELPADYVDACITGLALDGEQQRQLNRLANDLTVALHQAWQARRAHAQQGTVWMIDADGRLHAPSHQVLADLERDLRDARRIALQGSEAFIAGLTDVCATDIQRSRMPLIEGMQQRFLFNASEIRFSVGRIQLENSGMHDTPDLVLCVLLVDLPANVFAEIQPILFDYDTRASSLIHDRIAHAKRGTEAAIEMAIDSLAFVDGANQMDVDPRSEIGAPLRRAMRGFLDTRAADVPQHLPGYGTAN